MANKDNNQDNKIISKTRKVNPKIHKILFAEDLFNYFLQKNSLPAVVFSTELQREKGKRIFDDNLRWAADFLINTVGITIDQACRYIMENNFDNVVRFHSYANTLKAKVFESDYSSECFFYYCVFLAHLASKLVAQKFNKAPYMAMNLIIENMDLNRFRSTKKVRERIVQKYEKSQQESVNKVKQPSSHRKDVSFVQAIDVQRSIPPEQLTYCKAKKENIHREESALGTSKCGEDQQHVANKKSSKSQQIDNEYIPSISTFQSPLFSDFEEMKTFEFDPLDINLDIIRSSSCIGVLGPLGAESANLNSQEWYYGNFSEDGNSQQ